MAWCLSADEGFPSRDSQSLPSSSLACFCFSVSSKSLLPMAPRKISLSTVCWASLPPRSSSWAGPPRSTKPSARCVRARERGWGNFYLFIYLY